MAQYKQEQELPVPWVFSLTPPIQPKRHKVLQKCSHRLRTGNEPDFPHREHTFSGCDKQLLTKRDKTFRLYSPYVFSRTLIPPTVSSLSIRGIAQCPRSLLCVLKANLVNYFVSCLSLSSYLFLSFKFDQRFNLTFLFVYVWVVNSWWAPLMFWMRYCWCCHHRSSQKFRWIHP